MSTISTASFTSGWLFDVTLQATLLLAFTGGVLTLFPRLSAARRHFVQASVLLLIPVLILASLVVPGWRVAWPVEMPAVIANAAPAKMVTESPAAPPADSALSLKVSVSDRMPSYVWTLFWLGGAGAGGVVLMVSARSLSRLLRSSRLVEDREIQGCFQEEAEALGLHLPASSLRMSAECQVPMTWGLRRKIILLPEQANGWSETRLRLVLRHELAHIARGDILVSLLTTLAALLLWFHPFVWGMFRASQRTREQACDDLALQRSGQGADDFAGELLSAVAALGAHSGRPWLPLALAMSVSASARAMRGRLANLVQSGRGRYGFSGIQKVAVLLPVLGIAFGLAGLTACRKEQVQLPLQVLISSRFISIPVDSPVLQEMGLTLNGSSSLQNLGILSSEKMEELVRRLSQQRGVNLMSAPSVTTRSGQRATVEITREFIYPTEFDPPKQLGKDQAVIPTTPTAFEMRPVGIKMEVEPVITEDHVINLALVPEVTSFEGFMDYGKPIEQPDAVNGVKITENKMQMPIFHTLKTASNVVLRSGQSVVFGGLGSPEGGALTDRMPKTKDLVFFIIQAEEVDANKIGDSTPKTAAVAPTEASVTVVGEVKRQGKYTLKPGMTVKDIVAEAQGFNEQANSEQLQLKRGATLILLNFTTSGSRPLENGDVLTVPKK
ncbi:M56 family metallopeptidase [Brevifollis gellanilyticus]|uniref:Peptidase M56 domain-containing protein n=1 Tax=Brevifollis gellanilyticus TaxID=748831 RepID=A0A512MC00_9BACT|nr:M56 family metallopeptidase [Brevifollis gellanilyticus]GEP44256.1 hypothetical protein BGE01nite_35470 [Brevifollis gellanilyticus]